MEKANRRTKQHKSTKHKRLAGRSIEERPKAVERRKQFGHWEMDTVVGKRNGRESVILSLIERKTRCQLLRLIDGRDWDSVEFALREIKLEWGDCLRTITADNGPEFSTLNKAFEDTDTDIFYAHSYTSCDRGSNEAHNRMIRRDYQKASRWMMLVPARCWLPKTVLTGFPGES
ncbi:possible transposase [Secundilactobacillus oryzae JCM 18671]|uniref:Possible transposase n=1 Tax=Secundilactobacillus oryzae JCM 18671 TaxID=1291743 RepID=A0A081BKI5_9LACO|nr:possible transposase [Secundilactobacillus oryzae JCM 18671]